MNTKLLVLCVSVVVMVGYMAVFFIIQHSREMSAPPREIPADTRFKTTTIHYQDDQGREVLRESRFEVRTELISPEAMKLLPPPPGSTTPPTPTAAPTPTAPAADTPAVTVPAGNPNPM
jgi:hypothetical protein